MRAVHANTTALLQKGHLELELFYPAPEGSAFFLLRGELFFQLLAPDLRVALGLDGAFRLLVPDGDSTQ
jgi:hypothetical protein